MKCFEIVKAPYLKTGSNDVPEILRSLVQDAVNLAVNEVLFDVVVKGGSRIGDPLQWFITLRSLSKYPQQRGLVEKILANSIEERFRTSGYLIEPMSREEYEEAVGGSCERVCALVKEHPVYRANLSPIPYVQRPDVFKSSFEEVLTLLDGSGASLVFQIYPTVLTDQEQQTVRERAVNYMNASQMLLNHDQTAANTASEWADLVSAENTPFALCGIFVRGSHETTAAVTARLKSSYYQMSGDPVPFRNINLSGEHPHLFTLNELYANTDDEEGRLPGLYTMQELAVLCPLPVTEHGFCGLEGNVGSMLEHRLVPETFKFDHGMKLGVCPDTGRTLSLPYHVTAKSVCVDGETGCGKTTVANTIVDQATSSGIPAMVITPAKDFRKTARKAGMKILRMGDPGFCINPFQLPRDVELKHYKPLLSQVFEGCIAMGDGGPLPSIFQESISRVYSRYNYNASTKAGQGEPFGLTEFMEIYHSNVDDSLYDGELTGNIHSAGAFRVNKLIESCPEVFECLYGVTPEELLEGGGTLIEIDSDDFTSRVAVSILLIQLVAYIKATSETGHEKPLRAVIMVDEAHRLLDASDSHYATQESQTAAALCEKLFRNAISELRKERVGTVLLDQSITRLPKSLLDLCGTKVIMRLTGDEAEAAARKIGVDSRVFAHMETGEAIVVSSGLPPTYIQTFERSNGTLSDSEVETYMATRNQNEVIHHPFKACTACSGCKDGCCPEIRETADMLAKKIQIHRRKDGPLTGLKLESLCYAIPKILRRHGYNDPRLPACTAVNLMSRVVLATGLTPKAGMEHLVAAVDEIAREGGFHEENESL